MDGRNGNGKSTVTGDRTNVNGGKPTAIDHITCRADKTNPEQNSISPIRPELFGKKKINTYYNNSVFFFVHCFAARTDAYYFVVLFHVSSHVCLVNVLLRSFASPLNLVYVYHWRWLFLLRRCFVHFIAY